MKAVIHLHTKYSFDCLTPPEKLVDLAVQNGIDVLCITDHDTIEGSVHAQNYAQKHYPNALKVVIGAEFKTDCGDIIALNIFENIVEKNADTVIAAIRKQGGLVLLPHPFDSHKNIEHLANQADVIEIFNARSNHEHNQKSFDLASKYQKPVYAASDAHFANDAFLCINQFNMSKNAPFETILLQAERTFQTAYSPKKHYFKSQIIGGFKKRKLKLFLSATKNWLLTQIFL